MIWAYAICERPELPVPAQRGLDGAPLHGVRAGRLLAVVSAHGDPPDGLGVDALLDHERVVERLMRQRAALPMRFGTRLPHPAPLQALLAARHDELLTTLGRVRGRVEIAVRAMSEAAIAEEPSRDSGRAYLTAKLEHRNRTEATGAALRRPLAAVAVAETHRPGQAPGELFRAAYLVERTALARFRDEVQRVRHEHREAALVCTGPWPPYSFADVAPASSRVAPS